MHRAGIAPTRTGTASIRYDRGAQELQQSRRATVPREPGAVSKRLLNQLLINKAELLNWHQLNKAPTKRLQHEPLKRPRHGHGTRNATATAQLTKVQRIPAGRTHCAWPESVGARKRGGDHSRRNKGAHQASLAPQPSRRSQGTKHATCRNKHRRQDRGMRGQPGKERRGQHLAKQDGQRGAAYNDQEARPRQAS